MFQDQSESGVVMKELRAFVRTQLKTTFYGDGSKPAALRDRCYADSEDYRRMADDCGPMLQRLGEIHELWMSAAGERPKESDAQLKFNLGDLPDAVPSAHIGLRNHDPETGTNLELENMDEGQMERSAEFYRGQAKQLKLRAAEMDQWIEWRKLYGVPHDETILDWWKRQCGQ